jgi:division protein CdvB (Snf7/Vps24/ESCRT-III family)
LWKYIETIKLHVFSNVYSTVSFKQFIKECLSRCIYEAFRMSIKKWDKGGRIFERTPLKQRLTMAIHRLRVQYSRIEGAAMRMERHERDLFEKCVNAHMKSDNARAALYANECAEARKMAKVVLGAQLALEKALLRLETVHQLGETAAAIVPVAGILKAIQKDLAGVIPEVSYEIGAISDEIGKMVVEVGEATGMSIDMEAANEEAKKVLEEAAAVAEHRLKEKLPELPELPTPDTSTTTASR